MTYRRTLICLLALNILYVLLSAYLIYTQQQRNDFISLYLSAKALFAGHAPYQQFLTSVHQTLVRLPYNLNPPIVLILFSPFTVLPDVYSAMLWFSLVIAMGVCSFYLSIALLFSHAPHGWKEHALGLFYLMLGPCLANLNFLQLGTLLALLIIGGYYFLRQKRDIFAGVCWGAAIAIKFFPALLLFYLITQKKWKASMALICTVFMLSVIPLFYGGVEIYQAYFHLFRETSWYGDSWNASLYGYVCRIFSAAHLSQLSTLCLCSIVFLGYLYPLKLKNEHQAFAFTLLIMLLLSPFGWYYYCTLLIFPLLLLLKNAPQHRLFLFALILLNCPIPYLHVDEMQGLFTKIMTDSVYFYSLFLLIGLTLKTNFPMHTKTPKRLFSSEHIPIAIILSVCFFIRLISLLMTIQ